MILIQVEHEEIPLLRYSLHMWMAFMANNGGPSFAQFCDSDKDTENTPETILALPGKNMFWELVKKFVGKSDHSMYAIITGIWLST